MSFDFTIWFKMAIDAYVDEQLKLARTYFETGRPFGTEWTLQALLAYTNKHGIKLPPEAHELLKNAALWNLDIHLIGARKLMELGDYAFARTRMVFARRYAEDAGVDRKILREVSALKSEIEKLADAS